MKGSINHELSARLSRSPELAKTNINQDGVWKGSRSVAPPVNKSEVSAKDDIMSKVQIQASIEVLQGEIKRL